MNERDGRKWWRRKETKGKIFAGKEQRVLQASKHQQQKIGTKRGTEQRECVCNKVTDR